MRVFYGTNRRPENGKRPADRFGNAEGPLSFGFCDVSIPPGHDAGRLEAPRIWRLELRENPEQHVVLLDVKPVSAAQFTSELQRTVWESIERVRTPEGPTIVGGDAFIFVHGFNNSFEDAARRTAQIAFDLKFKGAPIMYSWPSQGSATLRGYQEDSRLIGDSEPHFLAFLRTVVRESGARRIHIIGHSMGNRLVSEAVGRMAQDFGSGVLPRLNQIVLTAPDIDAEYFKSTLAPQLAQAAERVTIYSSQEDLALKASNLIHRLSQRRLGEGVDPFTVFPDHRNIEVVDASAVQTDLFGLRHSYHADSPTVLEDIAAVLQGCAPGERGLEALFDTLAWRILTGQGGVRPAEHTEVK